MYFYFSREPLQENARRNFREILQTIYYIQWNPAVLPIRYQSVLLTPDCYEQCNMFMWLSFNHSPTYNAACQMLNNAGLLSEMASLPHRLHFSSQAQRALSTSLSYQPGSSSAELSHSPHGCFSLKFVFMWNLCSVVNTETPVPGMKMILDLLDASQMLFSPSLLSPSSAH